ncbi:MULTISPECIES: hypothetical protein [Ferrimonas]|uniref:hypothetical protein n=1 Tax=Ferrimonas TaxID=44011 RepID=UPI0012EB91D9|nr:MULTISPECIES: hypothetical protein [Ferrimonas]USD37296.1 hypothetical protein J8Z22_20310 [Ferrimonas sp. SCSIO 43195]
MTLLNGNEMLEVQGGNPVAIALLVVAARYYGRKAIGMSVGAFVSGGIGRWLNTN